MHEEILKITNQNYHFKDNIFSANHRNAMIQKYGYTWAEWLTINDLLKN